MPGWRPWHGGAPPITSDEADCALCEEPHPKKDLLNIQTCEESWKIVCKECAREIVLTLFAVILPKEGR